MTQREYMRQYMREYRAGKRRAMPPEARPMARRARVLCDMVSRGEIDPLLALSWTIDPPESFRRIAA